MLGDDRHEAKNLFHGRTASYDLALIRCTWDRRASISRKAVGSSTTSAGMQIGRLFPSMTPSRGDADWNLAVVTVDAIGLG